MIGRYDRTASSRTSRGRDGVSSGRSTVFSLYAFVTNSWHHAYTHRHIQRRKSMASIAIRSRTFCSVPRCGRSLLTVDTVPRKTDKKSPAINRVVRGSVFEYAREYGSRT